MRTWYDICMKDVGKRESDNYKRVEREVRMNQSPRTTDRVEQERIRSVNRRKD